MFTKYDIESLYDYEEKGLITGRQHPDLELVVWNYTAATQYGRLWDKTTLSTRGVVTDMQGRTVAQCIPKFFNLGEPENDGLGITDFDVAQEKLDGSLIHVFWYDGQWVCSSRGSFESDHAAWAQELIDGIDTSNFYRTMTYVAELIHPENRIVVDYKDEYSLRLLTTFSRYTGGWFKGTWIEHGLAGIYWPWDKVQEIPIEAVPTYLDQSNIEGVVLLGESGRAKIKTDEYVEHHRIVTGLTTKNVLEHYIEHGNVDELLEVAPDEWYERIGQLAWSFEDRVGFVIASIRNQFQNVQSALGPDASRKDFAMAVKGQRNAPYLFRLLDGKDITEMVQCHVLGNYERYGLEL